MYGAKRILEQRLNIAGYQLLFAGEPEIAVRVFRTDRDLYPKAWNTHDSPGEALAALGRTEEALANYRRSIELNPDNQVGLKAIRKLERRGGRKALESEEPVSRD